MAYQSEIEKLEARFEEKPEQWFAALADAYRKNKDLDLALDILDQWLAKRPNYTSGHIVRGRVLLDRGDDTTARQAFERVLEVDAENIIALRALSEISERGGDMGGARDWLKRLLEVDPMNEDAEQALAKLAAGPAAAPAASLPQDAADPEGFTIERASRQDLAATVPTEGLAADESPTLGEPPEGGHALNMDVADLERSTEDFLPDADQAAAPDESGVVAAGWDEEEAAADAASPMEGLESMEFDAASAASLGEGMGRETASEDVSGDEPVGGDLPLIMPDEVESDPEPATAPAAEEPDEPDVEPEPVVTETMADLYMRQGHLEQARDIYRELAGQRPDDPRLRRRAEELDGQLAGAPAAPREEPRKRYSAEHTGGLSARAYLRGILSGTAPVGPADATPMDDAFADEPLGEPTRRASDDVSLASVFGDEPPPPAPPASPAPGEAGKGGGFSFDEFFGGSEPGDSEEEPPEGPQSEPPPSNDPNPPRRDDDFRSWLKGLKT